MSELIKLATDAALAAAESIRSLSGEIEIHQKNSSFNLVTRADTESEKTIISMIRTAAPDTVILSEETNWQQNVMADRLWIVDPLDGTSNFAHSIPHFSISIAYAEKGIVKIAVIYDPTRNELFTAESGAGAFCNGKKITVSTCNSFNEAVIATGFYYDRDKMMQNTLFALHRLLKANVRGIRRMGSAALDLSWVACGRYDGYFEYMLSPWDFAAGMLLVREAGGFFEDRNGFDLGLRSQGAIAVNEKLHEDLLKMVGWSTICNLEELRLR